MTAVAPPELVPLHRRLGVTDLELGAIETLQQSARGRSVQRVGHATSGGQLQLDHVLPVGECEGDGDAQAHAPSPLPGSGIDSARCTKRSMSVPMM